MHSNIIKYICLFLFAVLPATRGFRFKKILLRFSGYAIGENVRCVSSAKFYTSGRLAIGADTWIGHEVLIAGGNSEVSIGAFCDIAPRVTLASGTHEINPNGPHIAGEGYSLPIKIGDGCWICTGATILGGTEIGERSIVAAGAVVRGVFPAGSLIGGVPAKVIKKLLHESSSNASKQKD